MTTPKRERIERNIYRQGDIYLIRVTDASGRQHLRSTRSKDIKHARALLAKYQATAFEGREFPSKARGRLTLQELCDFARQHMDEHRTSRDHGRHLDAAIAFFGPELPAISLDHEDMASYRSHLKTKPNGKPRSVSTINGYLVDLLTAFNLAVGARKIAHNPVLGFALKNPKNERDRTASPSEYDSLLEHTKDADLRLAIIIAYHTPMRLGEIVALERPRVFLGQRFIALGEAQTKNSEGRLVPLARPVVEALESFLRAHPKRTKRLIRPKAPSVRRAMQQVSKAFGEAADRAGCPDLTFHDLKHTSLTNFRLSGMDFSQMQKIAGNKTIALLVKRYQKVVDDELLEAVDRAARKSRPD